jgi:hypothetical protein
MKIEIDYKVSCMVILDEVKESISRIKEYWKYIELEGFDTTNDKGVELFVYLDKLHKMLIDIEIYSRGIPLSRLGLDLSAMLDEDTIIEE